MVKLCKSCLEEKDAYFFDKNRNTCRSCRNSKNTKSWLEKPGNLEKRREYSRSYQIKHRKENPYFKLYCQCNWDIKNKLSSVKENELKKHLESLFDDEMTWENYGEYWEVDHIISGVKMAKLGYTMEEINKLSNLRPLKVSENRRKRKE